MNLKLFHVYFEISSTRTLLKILRTENWTPRSNNHWASPSSNLLVYSPSKLSFEHPTIAISNTSINKRSFNNVFYCFIWMVFSVLGTYLSTKTNQIHKKEGTMLNFNQLSLFDINSHLNFIKNTTNILGLRELIVLNLCCFYWFIRTF